MVTREKFRPSLRLIHQPKQKMHKIIITLISSFFLFAAMAPKFALNFMPPVVNTPTLPVTPYNYANISLPPFFSNNPLTSRDNTPAGNPITDLGATLGRVLFYDVNLSDNNTISCASCHQQAAAFGDPAQFSVGFQGALTGRNSPHLSNARYYESGEFFWDLRAATLEDQVLGPIQSPIEMGMDLSTLETKLATISYYPALFNDAFGSTEITSEKISFALAQFVRSMLSFSSKYDAGAPNNGPVTGNFSNFTTQENEGKILFEEHCDQCHRTALQIADEPFNIGLDAVYTDNGVGTITGNSNDNGKFKTQSLRNIELTAPYMHDGRFSTLAEVIDFYDDDIQNHPNLNNTLRNMGQPITLGLTQNEKDALVAFLTTLTDNTFISDARWSDPFPAALPVEFVDFQARINQDYSTNLEWTTATEINNDFFEVMRSRDGINFETIHFEDSKGEFNGLNTYLYKDDNPGSGTVYYCIKQVDFNGDNTLSAVKSVYINSFEASTFKVFPTLVQNSFQVELSTSSPQRIQILVSDANGRPVYESILENIEGSKSLELNASDWSTGIYFVILKTEQESKEFRIVRQ